MYRVSFMIGVALLTAASLRLSAAGRVQDLVFVDVPNALETYVNGLNDRGDVVGSYKDQAGKTHGFLLRNGALTYPIDFPGATTTQVWGISNAGEIAGWYEAPAGNPPKLVQHGFVYRKGTFTPVDFPGASFTSVFGINAQGDVVGHYGMPPSGKMRGYVLRNGGFTDYGAEDWLKPNTMTCGFAISSTQQIVGHYQDAGGVHGFLLVGGVFTTLNYPGAVNTNAYGINSQGQVAGFYRDVGGVVRAFVMEPTGEFNSVTVPNVIGTWVRGINARNEIAGYIRDNSGKWRGFVATYGDQAR
jgi:uncharacterized membrane protein